MLLDSYEKEYYYELLAKKKQLEKEKDKLTDSLINNFWVWKPGEEKKYKKVISELDLVERQIIEYKRHMLVEYKKHRLLVRQNQTINKKDPE